MKGNEENCLVRQNKSVDIPLQWQSVRSSEDDRKLFDGFLGNIYPRRILRMARFRHIDTSNTSVHLFRIGVIEFETKSKKESYEIVPRSVRQFILEKKRYLFALFKHRLKTKPRNVSWAIIEHQAMRNQTNNFCGLTMSTRDVNRTRSTANINFAFFSPQRCIRIPSRWWKDSPIKGFLSLNKQQSNFDVWSCEIKWMHYRLIKACVRPQLFSRRVSNDAIVLASTIPGFPRETITRPFHAYYYYDWKCDSSRSRKGCLQERVPSPSTQTFVQYVSVTSSECSCGFITDDWFGKWSTEQIICSSFRPKGMFVFSTVDQ